MDSLELLINHMGWESQEVGNDKTNHNSEGNIFDDNNDRMQVGWVNQKRRQLTAYHQHRSQVLSNFKLQHEKFMHEALYPDDDSYRSQVESFLWYKWVLEQESNNDQQAIQAHLAKHYHWVESQSKQHFAIHCIDAPNEAACFRDIFSSSNHRIGATRRNNPGAEGETDRTPSSSVLSNWIKFCHLAQENHKCLLQKYA